MIELLNIDCMEYMKTLPDKAFDVIITSPPYNLGNNHHTGNLRHYPYQDGMPEIDYQDQQKNVLCEFWRILKDDGSVFYNHKNRIKEGKTITPYKWILNTPLILKQEIVWFNRSQNFDKCRFYPMTERVYWLSKTTKTLFKNNINNHDIFQWNASGTNKEHTRAFPIKLVTDLLQCFPKGRLFDPYMGSGTAAVAANTMGWDFVGCEIDVDYFNAAKERFDRETRQVAMW